MQPFNELLAEYLLAYGRHVRESYGDGIDGRSILWEMQGLSVIVKNEDMAALTERYEELKEDIAYNL